jgi:DNA-binding Lrp family transcriptional regulator
MLTEQDKQIIRELQNGLPLASRPFKVIADKLKLSEEYLIERIKFLKDNGHIRRFGAAVRHQDLGFLANAMVVWDVPADKVSEVGRMMAGFEEVSHCYQRPRHPGWPYNLFTVVHGQTREECFRIAEKIARTTGMESYRLLFSKAELKKSSMRYFE